MLEVTRLGGASLGGWSTWCEPGAPSRSCRTSPDSRPRPSGARRARPTRTEACSPTGSPAEEQVELRRLRREGERLREELGIAKEFGCDGTYRWTRNSLATSVGPIEWPSA